MATSLFKIPFDGVAAELGFIPLESASGPAIYNESFTEALTAADSLANSQTMINLFTESLTAADSLANVMTMSVSIVENGVLVELFTTTGTFSVSLTESLTVADSVVNGNLFSEFMTESLTAADSLAVNKVSVLSIVESLIAGETLATVGVFGITFTEALTAGATIATDSSSGDNVNTASTFGYSRFAALAIRQIADKGRGVTYIYKTPGAYAPSTDNVTGSSQATQTVKMLFTDYKKTDIDGTMIKAGDKMALLANDSLTATPKTGDQVTDDDQKFSVIRVEVVKPGDTVILYKLQLRRGGNS